MGGACQSRVEAVKERRNQNQGSPTHQPPPFHPKPAPATNDSPPSAVMLPTPAHAPSPPLSVGDLNDCNRFREALELGLQAPVRSDSECFEVCRAASWRGRQMLAESGDVQGCIECYETALRVADDVPALRERMRGQWALHEEIKVLQRLLHVRSSPPEEEHIHQHNLLVVVLGHLDCQAGEERVCSSVDELVLERSRIFLLSQVQLVEGLLLGALKFHISWLQPSKEQATLTGFAGFDASTRELDGVDWAQIEPRGHVQDLLFPHWRDTDTVLTLYNSKGLKTRQAEGGSREISVYPGQWEESSRLRGMIQLSLNWSSHHDTRVTFVHEFFHTIEAGLGIGPMHAWFPENRDKVPDWHGEHQYDYYAWRLDQEILPEYGCRNLQWSIRYPFPFTEKTQQPNRRAFLDTPADSLRRVQNLVSEAQDKMNSDGLQSTRELWQVALSVNPHCAEALEGLLDIHRESKSPEEWTSDPEALSMLDRLLQLRPESFLAHRLRGEVLLQQDVVGNYPQGKKELFLARDLCEHVESLGELSSVLSRAASSLLYTVRDMDLAEQAHRDCIELQPKAAWIYIQLGLCLLVRRQEELAASTGTSSRWWLQEVEQVAQQALQVSPCPVFPKASLLLGKVSLLRDPPDVDAARRHFGLCLQVKRSLAREVANAISQCAHTSKDLSVDQKMELYDWAVEVDPTASYTFSRRAWTMRSTGDREGARPLFRHAADLGQADAVERLRELYGEEYQPAEGAVTSDAPEVSSPPPSAMRVALLDLAMYNKRRTFEPIFQGHELEFHFSVVSVEQLPSALSELQVLIVPGGFAPAYTRALGEERLNAIRDWVRKGGHYLGICAGAFMGAAGGGDYLHLAQCQVVNRSHWRRGVGDVRIRFTTRGLDLLRSPGDEGTAEELPEVIGLRYANGPLFRADPSPAGREGVPPFEVLATFEDGMKEYGAADVMVGRPAIFAGHYFAGKIIVCSPHPEYIDGTGFIIRKLLRVFSAL